MSVFTKQRDMIVQKAKNNYNNKIHKGANEFDEREKDRIDQR